MRSNKARSLPAVMVAVLAATLSGQALADTASGSGAGATAGVTVDFRVVVPTFLTFRVGTANSADTITFNVPNANVGDGTVVNATAGSGDLGNGTVTVTVRSNGGAVTITPTNNSGGDGLGNGNAGEFISYAEIATATSAATGAGGISAPALSNAGGTAVALPATSGTKVNQRSANWTYTYLNSNGTIPAPGTYGTTGGTVTYTASIP